MLTQTPLFAELKTLKLCDIYDYTLGKYMYSQKNKLLPQPLLLTYSENQVVHSCNTRNKSLIQSQNRRTAIATNSHIHRAPYVSGITFLKKLNSCHL